MNPVYFNLHRDVSLLATSPDDVKYFDENNYHQPHHVPDTTTMIVNTVASLFPQDHYHSNNNSSNNREKEEIIILDRYRLEVNDKIGEGSFGKIYKAYDTHLNRWVAIKIESHERSQLHVEGIVYKLLLQKFPNWNKGEFFKLPDRNILVMDLLGKNIDSLFRDQKYKHEFTPELVAYLTIQMIQRLQQFHTIGYIHRDIKPQNFVIQRLPENAVNDEISVIPEVFLVDYGLSVPYMKGTDQHKDFSKHAGVHGTMRYCSINTHFGVEQSRRDDLISVAYTTLYLAGAKIPWKNISQHQSKQRSFYQIMISKMKTPVEKLASTIKDDKLKNACAEFLMYVLSLAYDENPDYDYCISIFCRIMGISNL